MKIGDTKSTKIKSLIATRSEIKINKKMNNGKGTI